MDEVPDEIWIRIAHEEVPALLLTCTRGASILADPHTKYELMISYGIGIVITKHSITWTRHGVPHRIGAPARECVDGEIKWYYRGSVHREDGPALVHNDTIQWFRHGVLHRDGGPAIVNHGSYEYWYRDGSLHRDDGPAVVNVFRKSWWQNGKMHRDDGPALVTANGDTEWVRNHLKHRDGGPAIECQMGQVWAKNGRIHRDGAPAVTLADGYTAWYRYGHRIDRADEIIGITWIDDRIDLSLVPSFDPVEHGPQWAEASEGDEQN